MFNKIFTTTLSLILRKNWFKIDMKKEKKFKKKIHTFCYSLKYYKTV